MLQNEYTSQERAEAEALIERAARELPFTLGHPIGQAWAAMQGGSYSRAMNHLLDFFEISAPFCSYVLLRLLMPLMDEQAEVRTVLQNFVNRIDQKRPLSLGDWLNDLLTPLMACAQKALPSQPLVVALTAHIYVRRRNVLLGTKHEMSIVQLRNEYRGHSTTMSEAIYAEVVQAMESRTLAMLHALEPLMQCRYDIVPGRYRISFVPAGAAQEIDLFPLVFVNDRDFRYVFHTLKDEQACYQSANENAVSYISSDMNALIDRDLQRIVPSFDISKDLNWEEVKTYAQQESARYLDRVYAEKKYNQELFVERRQLTRVLHDFWQAPQTLFPLIGEAGQGKTNQLCYWTEQLMARDEAVLIFQASAFTACTVEATLKRVFGYGHRKDVFRLLDAVHAKAEQNGRQVYVFIDGLNECLRYADDESGAEGPLALLRDVLRVLVSDRYPRLKVLFTCRVFTWKNAVAPALTAADEHHLFLPADEGGSVRGFDREETRRAYAIYQQLYQMRTPFDQLDRRVTLRLRDPLILKFTSTNFLGHLLSERPEDYTSLALFNQMAEDIGNSYAGQRQTEIIRLLADHLLDGYLQGSPADGLPVADVRRALVDDRSPLAPLARLMYKKDGVSIAYGELLNKADRPILKEVSRQGPQGEQLFIQFIYERFLEYVLGQAFVRKYQDRLTADTFAGVLRHGQQGVVFLGALRNALLQVCLQRKSFQTLIDLETRWGDDYAVMNLVTETMNTLIRENYEEELFRLVPQMLDSETPEQQRLVEQFNEVVRTIEGNRADDAVIARHRELSVQLSPLIRLKKLASVSVVGGMLLTDYFNERLYRHDALQLLWHVMADSIYDVRNDACMRAYYLSNHRHTLDYTPLEGNLTVRIVKEMYANIRRRRLLANLLVRKSRTEAMLYLETASRLSVLMIIDHAKSDDEASRAIVADMLGEMRAIFRYFTADLRLIRLFMPFFQVAMKRQVTFQSDYVNNAVEYQTFWEDGTFSNNDYHGVRWEGCNIGRAMGFIHHYRRFGALAGDTPERQKEEQEWADMTDAILSAYKTGDSLSHFVLERVLVIMGASRWANIEGVVKGFFTQEFRQTKWFDYCQMSMLYVLYQVAVNARQLNHTLLNIYADEARDWTLRCRGLFRGRRSDKANAAGLYKRNVMCWYAVVYATYAGDGQALEGDERPVPPFYELIDQAIREHDRELLVHLIENIAELITDLGYVRTALPLLKYILVQMDSRQKVDAFDGVALERGGAYQQGLVQLIGNVLSAAKNYFPKETDSFLQKEVAGLSFPGVPAYREEILNYHPSGERLQDLLTHRFGNFLMWSLLNVEAVDNFAQEAMAAAPEASSSFAWFERVIKILVRHFFGAKI